MTIALYILAITAVITLTFLAVDLFCSFQTWQRRIHIGRWDDREKWKSAVAAKAANWLRNPPTVPKRDNTRYILWDIITSNRRNKVIQSWQEAGLLLGLSISNRKISESSIVDEALIAYSTLTNISDTKSVKPQADALFRNIAALKQACGTIPYRKELPDIRFVDTIGLVCPFLVKYGVTFSCPEAIELAQAQIIEYSRFLHPATETPPHAFDTKLNTPLGIYDWGRGIGWYILGFTECFRNLPEGAFRDFLREKITSLGSTLLRYQLNSGGFAASIFCKNAPAEGSATVLCGLLFQQCFEITRDDRYSVASNRVISQLMKLTQRNGAIDMCQGDTKGIGNYSTQYGYMPFVQGLTLLLINRL